MCWRRIANLGRLDQWETRWRVELRGHFLLQRWDGWGARPGWTFVHLVSIKHWQHPYRGARAEFSHPFSSPTAGSELGRRWAMEGWFRSNHRIRDDVGEQRQ